MSNVGSVRGQQTARVFMGQGASSSNQTFAACIGLGRSDLRDKVFGILGLCKPAPPDRGLDRLTRPGYGKSTLEVMRDAIRYCLATFNTSSPKPFMLPAISQREEDLANDNHLCWTPVYDREGDFTVDESPLFAHHQLAQTKQFNVDLDLLTNADDPNVLLLMGRTLDTIEHLSPVLTRGIA
ncbi:hypothetical protein DOTSEDRAFT_69672 [Dothistroma septosporum NZE10]|uniref:Uncharacterized protein n=1 Tax=Dothistroma septosporum (strain NZE10 / CBS 128990) TaxID=675120 RepID=N1PXT9_DOTSN|nr:hypothetical protein DOTSEDRAFT_69672 [Dothistroma septosporum NZE10]